MISWDAIGGAHLVRYKIGLCLMAKDTLDAPYRGTTLQAMSTADVLHKAKTWAASVTVADGSWLQVLLNGKSIASFPLGEFWRSQSRASAGRPGAIHSPKTRRVCSIRISSAMLVHESDCFRKVR